MESRQNEMHFTVPKTVVRAVTKRNGELQDIDFMKIFKRLDALSFGLDMKFVNLELVVNKVIEGMYDGVKTSVLDELAAETCAYMVVPAQYLESHPPSLLVASSPHRRKQPAQTHCQIYEGNRRHSILLQGCDW